VGFGAVVCGRGADDGTDAGEQAVEVAADVGAVVGEVLHLTREAPIDPVAVPVKIGGGRSAGDTGEVETALGC